MLASRRQLFVSSKLRLFAALLRVAQEVLVILSKILGWPGGNSSKQVRLIHMHASRHDSVTLAQPTEARCGL